MITDNQAKEAAKTIAQYCSQHTTEECFNEECPLEDFCNRIVGVATPNEWTKYLEAEDEKEGEKNDR